MGSAWKIAAALLLAAGCATEPPDDAALGDAGAGDAPSDRSPASARPDEAPAMGEPPLRTGAESYALRRDGDWERTTLDFVFRNKSDDTLYQPTCRANGVGDPGLSLVVQERTAEGWEDVWAPMLLACLSEPIVVAPGGTYRDTFEIVLHPQDTVTQPRMNTEVPLDGTYRLFWHQLLRTYDPEAYPFGEEAADSLRFSNSFALRRDEG